MAQKSNILTITVRSYVRNSGLFIEIEDTGIGMMQLQRRIYLDCIIL